MIQQFEEISKIKGIQSIYVVNNKAEVIAENFGDGMNNKSAEALATRIIKIFAIGIYGNLKRPSSEIELIFEKGRVLALDCKNFVVIVVGSNETHFSMLRLSLSVQIKYLQEDKKFIKILENNVLDKKIMLRKDRLTKEEIDLLEKI